MKEIYKKFSAQLFKTLNLKIKITSDFVYSDNCYTKNTIEF
jgi:hypothetical protein